MVSELQPRSSAPEHGQCGGAHERQHGQQRKWANSWQEPPAAWTAAAAAPTSHGVSEGPRMLAPCNGEAERAAREQLLVVAEEGHEPRRASIPNLGG